MIYIHIEFEDGYIMEWEEEPSFGIDIDTFINKKLGRDHGNIVRFIFEC